VASKSRKTAVDDVSLAAWPPKTLDCQVINLYWKISLAEWVFSSGHRWGILGGHQRYFVWELTGSAVRDPEMDTRSSVIWQSQEGLSADQGFNSIPFPNPALQRKTLNPEPVNRY